MSSQPSHILTIPISSAVLEAVTTLIFELLLLLVLALLAQAICSYFNLHRLYNLRLPIKIGSPVLPLRVHAPIGHLPVSIALATFLLLASLMNNVLSFAINGRSQIHLQPTSFPTLVTFHPQVIPITIDFAKEFRVSNDDPKAPPFISKRLRAIRMADHCLQCNYSHCSVFAYAFPPEVPIDDELVHPDEHFPSVCITTEHFRSAVLWEIWKRFSDTLSPPVRIKVHKRHHQPLTMPNTVVRDEEDRCDIKSVNASFKDGNSFANASVSTTNCNQRVRDAVCFRRRGREPRCAAVAPRLSGGLNVLNFGIPGKTTTKANIAEVSRGKQMDEKYFQQYAATIAFMESIRMTGSLSLLQRMATATLRQDVVLERRDENETRLLSDVDLRIAFPGVLFNLLLLVSFVVVDCWLWYVAVYKKGRQNFNTFSSVPEVLEALSEESTDRRRVDSSQKRPGLAVGVESEQPAIGVFDSHRAGESSNASNGNALNSCIFDQSWDAGNANRLNPRVFDQSWDTGNGNVASMLNDEQLL